MLEPTASRRREVSKSKSTPAERLERTNAKASDALQQHMCHPSGGDVPGFTPTSRDDSGSDHQDAPLKSTGGSLERRKRLAQMKMHHNEQSMRSLGSQQPEDGASVGSADMHSAGSLTSMLNSFLGSNESTSSFQESTGEIAAGSNHSGKNKSVISSMFRLKRSSKNNWSSEASLEVDLHVYDLPTADVPAPEREPHNAEAAPETIPPPRSSATRLKPEREQSPRIPRRHRHRAQSKELNTTGTEVTKDGVKNVGERLPLQRARTTDTPSRSPKRGVRRVNSHTTSRRSPPRPRRHRPSHDKDVGHPTGGEASTGAKIVEDWHIHQGHSHSLVRHRSPIRRVGRAHSGSLPRRSPHRGHGSTPPPPENQDHPHAHPIRQRLPRRTLSGTTPRPLPIYRRTGSHNDAPRRPLPSRSQSNGSRVSRHALRTPDEEDKTTSPIN